MAQAVESLPPSFLSRWKGSCGQYTHTRVKYYSYRVKYPSLTVLHTTYEQQVTFCKKTWASFKRMKM